jgi:hypothetical protein
MSQPTLAGRLARWVVPALVAVAVAILAGTGNLDWALWTLASAALLLAIFLYWQSILALNVSTELTLDEVLSMVAPTAADEQKRALLRSLKDLDDELRLGKMSKQDHARVSAGCRSEARQLLRELDRELGPMREQAEALLLRRLRKAKLAEQVPATAQPEGAEAGTPAAAVAGTPAPKDTTCDDPDSA